MSYQPHLRRAEPLVAERTAHAHCHKSDAQPPGRANGALAVAGGTCGQILEGPLDAVEATFERIGNERRHQDVILLDLAPIGERSFGGWSLALVEPGARPRLDAFAEPSGFTAAVRAGERLHALLGDRLARRTCSMV